MRFQIGRLIGDGAIGRGMALVEAVFSEQHHLIKQFIRYRLVHTPLGSTLHEDAAMLLHLRHFLLAHRPPKQICLAEGIAGEVLGNAHDLLLVDHDSVGFTENRFQNRVGEVNRFATMFAVDEFGNQAGIQRTGSIQRQD